MKCLLNRLFILLLLLPLLGDIVIASDFPNKPITIYVPFSKGGTASKLTRFVAQQVSKDLGVEVIVETNDTGLSSTEYINQNKSLPNNGYHLIVGNLGTHASGTVFSKETILYDPIEDFEPIALLGETPMYLVVRPDFPAKNFKAFMDYYQTLVPEKRKLTIAHSGKGSTSYLAAIYFASILKLDLSFIPYTGSDAALKDVANGYVDMMIDQTTSSLSFIHGGLVKGEFVTSARRSELTPSIPTSKQVGLHEFNIKGWNMIFVPKKTPANIIYMLNQAFLKALDNRFVRAEFIRSNTEMIDNKENNHAALKDFLKEQLDYWQEIAQIIEQKDKFNSERPTN